MNLAIVGIGMALETVRGSLPTSRTADSLVRIDRASRFLRGCRAVTKAEALSPRQIVSRGKCVQTEPGLADPGSVEIVERS